MGEGHLTLTGARALSPTMYGREPQLGALLEHLRLARTDGGRIVLVSGEAGIGKTRLTAEILRQIDPDQKVLVLQGHCYDADPAIPYGPSPNAQRQPIQVQASKS